eukprot:4439898-Alexandrium_andersonii.AAC.1
MRAPRHPACANQSARWRGVARQLKKRSNAGRDPRSPANLAPRRCLRRRPNQLAYYAGEVLRRAR